jgi:signal transduction histidine kinase
MRFSRATFALLLAVALARAADAASEQGYAVIDQPETHRPFIAGSVWSLALTTEGVLFVGSNRLAVHDGRTWQRIEIPNTIRVLALAAEPNNPQRVWFGAEGPLGFVERSRTGEWTPTLLDPALAAADITDVNDVRQVQPDGRGGAWFVARSKILRWDGAKFTAWELPNPLRLWSFLHRGVLHAHQQGVGVWRIAGDRPELWLREDELPAAQPLIRLVETPDGGELAVFREDCYRRTAAGWERIPEVAQLLEGRRALHVERVDAETIAIGTAYGGVFLVGNDGALRGAINSQFGLADDSIDALLAEHDGNLWIGTGTGVQRVIGAGRVSQFDQRARLAHGFVRRVTAYRGHPFVITSRRAYELTPAAPTEPAHFFRIETLWPQLREAVVQRNELWLGGTGGIWRVNGREVVRDPRSDGDVFALLAPRTRPEWLLAFDRNRARALDVADPSRPPFELGAEVGDLPVAIAEDRAGRVWVATRAGHVHAWTWRDAPLRLEPVAHFAPGRGLPEGTQRPQLTTLDGEIVVFTEQAALRLDGFANGFRVAEKLRDFTPEAAVELPDGTAFWSVQHRQLGASGPHALLHVRRTAEGGLSLAMLSAPGFDHISDVTSLSLTDTGGRPALWVGGENALVRIETGLLRPAPAPAPARLRALEVDGAKVPLARRGPAQFSADVNRIAFSFAAPVSDSAGLLFQTRLHGVERDWAAPDRTAQREFTGLAAGDYAFEMRTVDRFGRTGPVTAVAFTVVAPWYARRPALAAWIALAAAAVWGVVRWRVRRLHRQAERLNELVHERTRELSLSNTAKTELLESLSHEIRRPLNGIVSLIERLDHAEFAPAQRESARQLRRASESLSRVFDELLNFSQLDYGAVKVEARSFQLRTVLGHVLADYDAERTVTVRWAEDFVDGFVGDDLKLETIVGNFVANALKYAPGAPVEIHVSATLISPELAEVLVEVSDGGPGVPADEQEVIFKRFVRGSRAKASGLPGTGIGLATCRGMARLLGGSVGVESPAERARERGWSGPGATFFVRVPLRRGNPVA